MCKESEFQKEIDVGRIIEATLLGVFLLIGRYFWTIYLFLVKPSSFSGELTEEERALKNSMNNAARPLTFLSVSLLVVLSFIASEIFQLQSDNKYVLMVLDGLRTLDAKKLLIVISPILLGIGLYAYMITKSAVKRGYDFAFEKSIGLSSYFCGGVIFTWLMGLFIQEGVQGIFSERSRDVDFYFPILWVLVYCRFFYCYAVVLCEELKVDFSGVEKIWWGGTWRFLFSFMLIIYLLWPIINPN